MSELWCRSWSSLRLKRALCVETLGAKAILEGTVFFGEPELRAQAYDSQTHEARSRGLTRTPTGAEAHPARWGLQAAFGLGFQIGSLDKVTVSLETPFPLVM